jgi:hypothetical protein
MRLPALGFRLPENGVMSQSVNHPFKWLEERCRIKAFRSQMPQVGV